MREENAMSDDNTSNQLSSLDDLNDLTSDGSAQIKSSEQRKAKVKQQKWGSDDSASGLLDNILLQTAYEAEEEERRLQQELQAKEEAERRAKEEAEYRKRLEGEQRLAEEKRRQEDVEKRRTIMAQAIERDRKIAAGEIDPEAEARREAEAREKAEREKAKTAVKDETLSALQAQLQQQEARIRGLTKASLQPVPESVVMDAPKRSALPMVIATLLILLVGGAAIFYVSQTQQPEQVELRNPLAMKTSYDRLDLEVDDYGSPVSGVLSEGGEAAAIPVVGGPTGDTPVVRPQKKCKRGERLRGRRCVKKRKRRKRGQGRK